MLALDRDALSAQLDPLRRKIHLGGFAEGTLASAPRDLALPAGAFGNDDVAIHHHVIDRADCENVALPHGFGRDSLFGVTVSSVLAGSVQTLGCSIGEVGTAATAFCTLATCAQTGAANASSVAGDLKEM